LPLWYKGIIPESLAVRKAIGLFDVSHMGRAIVRGKDAEKLLNRVTTNDVSSLKPGGGQYSLICNEHGGIKDDLTVFKLQEQEYLAVYNAGNRTKDYEWIRSNAGGLDVELADLSDDVAMFAVQGPRALELIGMLSKNEVGQIPRFGWIWTELKGQKVFVSRTGYTGEDGVELLVWDSPVEDPDNARVVWDGLLESGRAYGLEPCGLGARDLLRLEAGMCLYGTDMDETTNPYEARLGFLVKLHKDFIGKEKLQEIKEKGTERLRVGLAMSSRIIPRHGFEIHQDGRKVGVVTSGTLSPLLNRGIAMGYVLKEASQEGALLEIHVRQRTEQAKVVKPPFYDTTKYGYLRKS